MTDNTIPHDIKTAGTTINTDPVLPTATSTATSPAVKMLSPADLRDVCQRIGAPPSRWEQPTSTSSKLPPDVPSGLYKEVISARRKYQLNYYFTATLYNTCIVLQLLFGAALTALGSSTGTHGNGVAITILAAANTVNAGIIALLHNSGLPNRIKQDWSEFAKVESYLEEMMNAGIVDVNMTKVDAVAKCWDLFNAAKDTVSNNEPDNYTAAASAAATAATV